MFCSSSVLFGLVEFRFFSKSGHLSLYLRIGHIPPGGGQVREESPGQSEGQVQPGVRLSLALVYENGAEVRSQNILQMQADGKLLTNEQGRANLKVG